MENRNVPTYATYASDTRQTLRDPVVWALDAFPGYDHLHERTAQTLLTLYPDSAILPVYVLSEETFTQRGFTSFLKPALKPMALKAVQNLLRELDKKRQFHSPRILTAASGSRADCARKLLRFAEKIGAKTIAAGAHCRGALSRFFVSSFSEAVLSESKLPLLLTGPQAASLSSTPRTVVFPADFSRPCVKLFEEVLDLAANFGAEVHLYHRDLGPIDSPAGLQLLGSGWIPFEPYYEDNGHREEIAKWKRLAAERGVTTHIVTDTFHDATAEAILNYVRRVQGPVLLAMKSHASGMEKALLGSVTREVLRQSPCPVYAFGHAVT